MPFTPISEAMASAAWLHTIVSSSSTAASDGTPRGKKKPEPAERLARFVSVEVAEKLMKSVHALAGKTSAALREDAFLVTINGVAALAGAGHNVSLDNLVKRRQEEAVQVFAYFMERILEGEHARLASEPREVRSGGGDGTGVSGMPPPPPRARASAPGREAWRTSRRSRRRRPNPRPRPSPRPTLRSAPGTRRSSVRRAWFVASSRARWRLWWRRTRRRRSSFRRFPASSDSTRSTCPASSSRSCARTPPCRAR